MFGHDFRILVCSSMRGRYKIQIAEGWKWQRIFPNKRVRFARADKAVALLYSTTTSEAQTPTYVEVLPLVIVQAYRVRRSTSRYGLSHRDQSRRDVWMGVITPHFRDRCITPSWMTALGHFLSTPSLSSLPERPV